MDHSYSKKEKLKSKKQIEQLFAHGSSISVYPLRLVYMPSQFEEPVQIKSTVSVSKRFFKKAVDRNRIKRLMREAYRLNQTPSLNDSPNKYVFMILYFGKEMPSFIQINSKMALLLESFTKKVIKQ